MRQCVFLHPTWGQPISIGQPGCQLVDDTLSITLTGKCLPYFENTSDGFIFRKMIWFAFSSFENPNSITPYSFSWRFQRCGKQEL